MTTPGTTPDPAATPAADAVVADQVVEPVTPAEEDEKDDTSDPNSPTFTGEYDAEKASALIAKLRTENKELKPLAQRSRDADEAAKSETTRLMEALALAQGEVSTARSEAMRSTVAHAKGLSAAQAKRLVGDDLAALEADADELLESFRPTTVKPHTRKPVGLQGGSNPGSNSENVLDPAAFAADLAKKRRGY
jgi:hypothetical protein